MLVELNLKTWYNEGLVHIQTRRWPYISWKHNALSGQAIGGTALTICLLAASTFNSFAKQLGTALSPLSLVFVSELLTCSFVLISFGLFPVLHTLGRLKKRELCALAAAGVLGGLLGPMLWFTGLSLTTAVNASLFGKADIIFMLLLAQFILGERLEKAHFFAISAVFVGILFVTLQGFSKSISFQPGDLIIIIATLSFACSSIVYRRFIAHIDGHIALFCRSSIAIIAFLILSSFIDHRLVDELKVFPLLLVPTLIGFGLISRFLNSMMYYKAIEYLPVSTISLVSTLDMLSSTIFAYFYLGEMVQWYHIAGGSFLILGNILLALFRTPTHAHVHSTLKHHL